MKGGCPVGSRTNMKQVGISLLAIFMNQSYLGVGPKQEQVNSSACRTHEGLIKATSGWGGI